MYIILGTYDVQDVSLSLTGQDLTMFCSYVANSTARGCLVTVCLRRGAQIDQSSCAVYNSPRSSFFGPVRVSEVGEYVVTSVADIEEDGTINAIEELAVFHMWDTAVGSTITADASQLTPTVVTLPSGDSELCQLHAFPAAEKF